MSKAEVTRTYIIEKSAPLFNMKGYAGTSLSDITKATGLTKGAIYGNFENKDEIAAAVFEHSVCELNKRIDAFVSHENNAYKKLIAFSEFYRRNWKIVFERGGCVIQNASIEADDNLAFLKKNVQASIHSWIIHLSQIIEQGQRERLFKKKCDPCYYAYTIITLIEGGIMLAKIMNDPRLLLQSLDRIKRMIDTELLISTRN